MGSPTERTIVDFPEPLGPASRMTRRWSTGSSVAIARRGRRARRPRRRDRRAPPGCPDRPSRVAPAATISRAAAAVRTPPLALTPRVPPTVLAISEIAWAEAPPAGWNPVEVLTKSAPGLLADDAGTHDLVVGERGRLEDDLEQDAVGGGANRADLLLGDPPEPGLDRAHVDDHVDLVGAVGHGPGGLGRLDVGMVLAAGESHHRAGGDLR